MKPAEIAALRGQAPLSVVGCREGKPCPRCKEGRIRVVEAMRVWHCFRCKAGGDVFAWVMQVDGVTFALAVKVVQILVVPVGERGGG